MKSSLSIISMLFLALAACSAAREFEISRYPYEISLEELAEFSPEGVGEEVFVHATLNLEGDILELTKNDQTVRVDVSETLPEVLQCVSENGSTAGQVSLYFNPRIDGAVITFVASIDNADPSNNDILCADIVAFNAIVRNADEAGLIPEE